MKDLRSWARELQRKLDAVYQQRPEEDKPKKPSELRKFPRIALNPPKPVQYILRNKTYAGRLHDISKGGLRMQGPGDPAPGLLIALDVPGLKRVTENGAVYDVGCYLLAQIVHAKSLDAGTWEMRCKLINHRETKQLVVS